MRFSAIATAAALVGAVSAEVFKVAVGKTNLTFEPESIEAKKGDTIMFVFWPKNHTLTQSSFAQPCENYTKGGLDSGFIGYDPNVKPKTFKVWNVTLDDDTKPKWFSCRQKVDDSTTHCSKGMVFSINPTLGKGPDGQPTSADAFKKLALAAKPNVAAVDGQASSSSGSASATDSASKSDATSASGSSGSSSASDSKSASGSGSSSGTASGSSGSAQATNGPASSGSASLSDSGKPSIPTSTAAPPASSTPASSAPASSTTSGAGAITRNTVGALTAAGAALAFLL